MPGWIDAMSAQRPVHALWCVRTQRVSSERHVMLGIYRARWTAVALAWFWTRFFPYGEAVVTINGG